MGKPTTWCGRNIGTPVSSDLRRNREYPTRRTISHYPLSAARQSSVDEQEAETL